MDKDNNLNKTAGFTVWKTPC